MSSLLSIFMPNFVSMASLTGLKKAGALEQSTSGLRRCYVRAQGTSSLIPLGPLKAGARPLTVAYTVLRTLRLH